MKEHEWTKYFDVDIMDVEGNDLELDIQNGALDVFFTPIYMKKNIPAYCMTVACRRKDMFKLQNIIFKETTKK